MSRLTCDLSAKVAKICFSIKILKHFFFTNHKANYHEDSVGGGKKIMDNIHVVILRLSPPKPMTKMSSMPFYVKTIQKSLSPEQMGKSPLVLVCNIRDSGLTKFVLMMLLG